MPSLYLSHRRVCVDRHGTWLPVDPHAPPAPQERLQLQQVCTNCILDRSQTQFTPSAATTAAEVVAELEPQLKKHGAQAQLARSLGLDRQAVHAFVKSRTRMPDAERTLQLVAWLMAVREGEPPA